MWYFETRHFDGSWRPRKSDEAPRSKMAEGGRRPIRNAQRIPAELADCDLDHLARHFGAQVSDAA